MSPSEREAEFYLSHASYVRALARRLVYDRDAADDLFQEAWLAALTHTRRGGSSTRRWLASVVRNLALKRWHSDERRRERELEPPRATSSSSPDEVLAHEAARRSLVAALLALEEPYRATLIRHYFDGLTLRAIADAEGVPLETVRTRLKRGLERMRARLGARDEARRETLAALALGAPTWREGLRRLIGGTLLMSSTQKFVAAALVAAALLIAVRAFDDSARAPESASAAVERIEPTEPGDARVDVQRNDVEPSTVLASNGAPVRPAATTGELSVAVLWAHDRRPAADIALRIGARSSQNFDASVIEARTDDAGRARIADLMPATYTVELDRGVSDDATVRAGERTELELVVPPGVLVRGRVLDQERNAVAGAEICLLSSPRSSISAQVVARSGADGRFTVLEVPASNFVSLSARASGYAPSAQVAIEREVGDTAEVELVLEERGGALAGRVVDSSGEPIAHASIVAGSDGGLDTLRAAKRGDLPLTAQRAFTDEHGEYHFASLAVGRIALAVVAARFAPTTDFATIERGATTRVDFVLEPQARLEGSVRDERGAPIARAWVHFGVFGIRSRTVSSADDGSFALDGLPRGEFVVEASAEGRGLARATFVGVPGQTLRWDATLRRDLVLHVQLVAPGRDLAGWRIDARPMNFSESNYFASQVTDAQGRVEFANGPEVRLHLDAISPTSSYHPVASLDDVDPRTGEATLTADPAREPSARVVGRVVDATGSAVTGSQVSFFALDNGSGGTTEIVGEDGGFRSSALPPGEWRVVVDSESYASTWSRAFTLHPAEIFDVGSLTLERGGEVEVRVVVDAGIDLDSLMLSLIGDAFCVGALKPRDGSAHFHAITSGTYRLIAYGADVALRAQEVSVRDGETSAVELHLTRGVDVKVEVRDEAGHGVVDRIETELFDSTGRSLDTSPALPFNGPTLWQRTLAPGVHRLRLRDHRGRSAELAFEVNVTPLALVATLR